MLTKTTPIRRLLLTLLTLAILTSVAQPALAAEKPAPERGAAEYLNFVAKSPQEQMVYIAGGKNTPEYRQFITMYVDEFIRSLPPDYETSLTYLPAQGDEWSWRMFFSGKPDYQVTRDEAYRIAKELDLNNPNLSLREKAARIDGWASSEKGKKGELLNTNGEIPAGDPWIITEGSNVYHAGPLINKERTINGASYDCDERTMGLIILYRIAGIPSCHIASGPIHDKTSGSHVEAGYCMDGTWWVNAGRNYSNGQPTTLVDYAINPTVAEGVEYYTVMILPDAGLYRISAKVIKPDPSGQKEILYDSILDLNLSWVRPNIEEDFMNYNLFHSQFIHNEIPLTRGDVAKLLCTYLSVAPMRSEQVFSDVPPSDPNSRYIWAVNRMGLMTGDGDGRFRPNSELTMQEFAAVACRVVDWGKQYLSDVIASGNTRRVHHSMTTPEQRLEQAKAAETLGKPKTFADSAKIAPYAKTSVDRLSSLGVLSGDGNGYLKPTDKLDRLRFAIMLYKLDLIAGKHGEGLITGLPESAVF
jgi:hypothetical protein